MVPQVAARLLRCEAYLATGELEPGAYGVATPVLGVEGLEASVGVIALVPLDAATVGPAVGEAATAIATALR